MTTVTITMTTTNSRIKGKKPSGLMLPPMGIMETVPCVKGALEAEALELRRASLALTLLYLASKSLVGLSSVPVTAEEKTNKKNDVKARSLLLMALPNEHQLTFSQYSDAKTMFAAIKMRFGRNEATKKTHKALLKQQYENFNASSTESLDTIFNKLQKVVSSLAILGVIITPEDLNSKFLRSLPPEWNTHVVVWMNKDDIETISIDGLYNNFKIVEQDVNKTVGASTGTQNMAFMTAPNTNGTNNVNTANSDVCTVNSNVNTASPKDCTASLSDATVYAFLASQPNRSQLIHEDLKQIHHDDDLEEMDLKWQLALLSMRARKFYQRTRKKITINGSDTAGYDKSKNRNHDSSRNTLNVEKTSSKAMLAINGVGFDRSDMAEEQVQMKMDLMAFSDSEFVASTYKRGLATVKEQLVTFRKNEVLFSEEIGVLKKEVACKDYEIGVLQNEFEKVKQEKESIDFKIVKFDKSSKSLGELLESQITDKSKKGLEYHVVAPPRPVSLNAPTKLDLSYSGLDEFKEPEFNRYGPRDNMLKSAFVSEENIDNSLLKEQVSVDENSYVSVDENSSVESPLNVDKETTFHVAKKVEFVKPKHNEKPVRKSVRYAEMYRSQSPRGNKRNWNGQKSNQLGNKSVMYNKACFICGSFDHVQIYCPHHQRKRMVTGNNYNRVDYNYYTKTSHPRTYRNMTPRAVLLKSSLTPLNTARPVYITQPIPIVHSARLMSPFSNQAQSTVQRPFNKKTTLTNRYFNQKVNTGRPRAVNTARLYRAPVNTVRANRVNAVKASACWDKPQMNDKGFVDSGCSRHMTGNIAYLSNFKEFDKSYVTFGGGAYGGRITGKVTLKTDSLDFEDVHFVNELKFNLFSVSQMCDKKNYVLFTDTECLVLSSNFKLPDESQILFKIPREDNMYSFDMKNIVPKESLTCLVAKATSDESMLWHKRLGHINFKNINKLVKENLVRGLPLKCFENDQTCVACLKGKQHRASCKSKVLNPITKPLFMLHMDLFGLTFMSNLMHKKYCLVVSDDYSKFTWVFFLATKDETSEILKNFIKEIENLVDKKSNTTAKLPLLKLGEYEMWEIRIKQYFQVQDYALWEVIENGNSWVSVPQTTQENGTSVTKHSVPVTAEEKINKKNYVKARSLLLMALPNEHLLTFSQYSDAKTLYAAIKTRFGDTKRLLVGLQSWMNKDDIETMSIDDLYNNFKIVEQEVKKSVGASTSTQNMAFVTAPSTSSTNNVNTANSDVSTVSTNVNTASPKDSTATLSDATVYAFLANQPNGSQLVHEDLEQIHDDDLEEMDLKLATNKVLFSEEIRVLKREVACKDYEIGVLKTEFEKVKQEKEDIDFKIAKFGNASKDLDKLLEIQITDKSKKGLGYHVVAPPHPLTLNAPTRLDLSYSEQVCVDENSSVSVDENSSVESPLNGDKKLFFIPRNRAVNTARPYTTSVNTVRANRVNVVKPSACWVWRPTRPNGASLGNPQLNDKGFVDSGCSRHMTSNIAYLLDFKEFDGGYVTFRGGAYGGRITSKGTLKTDSLDFEDVHFVMS
ncbi:putative ribonuclease H-like domain-containing protein [Tanacetum coccineum]